MRPFLRKAALFCAIQLAILVVALAYYRVDPNAFVAAYLDKHRRLGSVTPPRLLLVGGSNTAFATDSAVLERAVGRPVVNLGIQHALGLRFMLREASRAVRSGDLIVVSLEYDQYGERGEESISIFGLLEQAPSAWADLDVDWTLFKRLADGSHGWLRGVLRSDFARARGQASAAQVPYTRDSFNVYGDVTAHWSLPPRDFVSSARQQHPDGETVIPELNDFALYCGEHGAKVLIFHPTTTDKKYAAMRLDLLSQELQSELHVKQLNRIEEMRYPRELLFDSSYHLTYAGVERRTKLLAERLLAERGAATR